MEREILKELIEKRDRMLENYDKFAGLPMSEFEAFHRKLMALNNRIEAKNKNIKEWKWM